MPENHPTGAPGRRILSYRDSRSRGDSCADFGMAIQARYPRERGESASNQVTPGLSPQARGNLRRTVAARGRPRSIPASAGERGQLASRQVLVEVYPRERGGTFSASIACLNRRGLSPRARGNGKRGRTPATLNADRHRGIDAAMSAAWCASRDNTPGRFGKKGVSQ